MKWLWEFAKTAFAVIALMATVVGFVWLAHHLGQVTR